MISTDRLDEQLATGAFYQNPYPVYRALRRHDPVHWFEPWGQWLVSRHEDVAFVLKNPQIFSSVGWEPRLIGALPRELADQIPQVREHFGTRVLLNSDPPEHTRLRRMLTRSFVPRAVDALRPTVVDIVNQLLRRAEGQTEFELISNFAYPLPALVIAGLLGVPEADRHLFTRWSGDFAAFIGGYFQPAQAGAAEASMTEFRSYLRQLIEHSRRARGTDLLSGLIWDAPPDDRLSDDELIATGVTLLFAGHETTANLIGNGVLALLTHDDQRQRLVQDPSRIPRAVEELLRYESPVQRTRRVTLVDVELGGHTIPAGALVTNLLGSANRDAARFPDPDRLDVDRADVSHIGFGHGIHFCVGAALSRLEVPIALNELLHRFPDMQLSADQPQWKTNHAFRGLTSLPVVLGDQSESARLPDAAYQ
jgi:pimeloyl-[acyl-carrier protein] synthase